MYAATTGRVRFSNGPIRRLISHLQPQKPPNLKVQGESHLHVVSVVNLATLSVPVKTSHCQKYKFQTPSTWL